MQELYDELQRERDQLESRVARAHRGARGERGALPQPHLAGLGLVLGAGRAFRFTSIAGNTELYPGHTIGEHVGRTRWEHRGYEPPEGGWAAHRALLDAHQPFQDLVFRFQPADGSAAYAAVSGEPVFAPDGALRGLPRHRPRHHRRSARRGAACSGWRASTR